MATPSRYPKASITVVEGLSSAMQEWLLLGEVDLAIIYESGGSPLLRLQPLAQVPLCVIGRSLDPSLRRGVQLADRQRLPLIMPRRPNAIRIAVEATGAREGLAL